MVVRYSMEREPSGATLHGTEHTVQPLHEGIGNPMLPVGQDAGQVFLHGVGKLFHLREQRAKAFGSHPDPATPGLESTLGLVNRGQLVGILECQAHLVGLHRRQITLGFPVQISGPRSGCPDYCGTSIATP
jgi:hypothetical protein